MLSWSACRIILETESTRRGDQASKAKTCVPKCAEVAAKAAELRDQGKTHMEVCEALNVLWVRTRTGKLWRHPQQIVKLLHSFHKAESD